MHFKICLMLSTCNLSLHLGMPCHDTYQISKETIELIKINLEANMEA